MEAEGGAHRAQVSSTSPAEGGGEGARLQEPRKRRPWTAAEDALLVADVRAHGVGKWDAVTKRTGLARTYSSCRYRWFKSLLPGLKDGAPFSRDEELRLCRLHLALGNQWSRIAAEMEDRSESELIHYWFSYVNRCQKAGVSIYPPEVQQAAAGQSDLHRPELEGNKSQTSSLPQQPPPPSYLLPVVYPNYPTIYPNYPAVVPTHPPQPLGAVYPVTMATAPPPPPSPVIAELEALPDSQFWPLFLQLLNQDVEQGRQPQPPLVLSNQNVEQGKQPQPPSLHLEDATEFNEENQLLASLLRQSNQNVEQGSQPQPPALPMENATEFNVEGHPLTSLPPLSNQNVEPGRQPHPSALLSEIAMEFNKEGQPSTSLPPLPDQNVEQERQPQLPPLPLENATELNEGGQPLSSLSPLWDQNVEQGMQPQSPAPSFGGAPDFFDLWGFF